MNQKKSYLTSVAILCFTSFSCSIYAPLALGNVNPLDTAFYYNEHGKLLYRDGSVTRTINYVIKTKKQPGEIFQEIPAGDSTVKVSDSYAPAAVQNISRRTARRVERLIRKGCVNDTLVINNVIPVLDQKTLRRMYDNIQSLCKNNATSGFTERGGVLLPDGTLTCITGDISDPRNLTGAALLLKQKGLVYYHSHPDGSVEKSNSASFVSLHASTDKVYFDNTQQTEWVSYIQGPSKQDQDAVGNSVGYVFGMSAGSATIYIYDCEGVKATLPMWFVKKLKTPAAHETHKVDTYLAGIIPARHMSHSF